MRLRFLDCRLNTDARQLVRHGRAIPLSPKAFDLLKLLAEERPRALPKGELLEIIWPNVFVSEASLARVISEIRRGLDDPAHTSRIVRTVHSFGYAFIADAEEERPVDLLRSADGVGCWLACEGQEFALADGEHVVGREPGLAIRLDSPKVSRRHARVVVRGEQATIEDLGSKNGTFVGGVRLAAPVTLAHGDAVRIGEFKLTFYVSARLPPTETEIRPQS